ncbi:MAG: hypothetical protein ACUVTO_09965 [Candidatus Caldatribacteriaceae bacterium]
MLHDGPLAVEGPQVLHIRLDYRRLQEFHLGIPDALYQLKPFPLHFIYLFP